MIIGFSVSNKSMWLLLEKEKRPLNIFSMSMPEGWIYLLFKELLNEKTSKLKITAPGQKLDLRELLIPFLFTA